MKKTNYSAPQIEVVRFETENVLGAIISGKEMGKDVTTAGDITFGPGTYRFGE